MQFDAKAAVTKIADAEMDKLSARAKQRLDEGAAWLEPEDFDVALERARELFNGAPWLSDASTNIGGCLHMQYRDLFALLLIAQDRAAQ